MEEKTAFDLLFDKLSARGMRPEKQTSEHSFVVPGKDRVSNTKYLIGRHKNYFFCAYDSYGTSAYASRTFTGIYASIQVPRGTDCQIHKKDWLDRFSRKNKRKSGINFIDEKLTITSSTQWTPSLLLNLKDVHQFLEINQRIAPLKIIIQKDYLPIIEELKDKTVIGIETNWWVYEDADLDLFLNSGGQLIEKMSHAMT